MSPFPSCAFWNMQYLSITESDKWDAKVRNMQQLVLRNHIVGVTETHTPAFKADALFFHRIAGAVACLADDMVILLEGIDRSLSKSSCHHP